MAAEAILSEDPQPRLGRRLKALRVGRGLSLKEVAAGTGVSASFLSMVETGRNEMSVGRLMRMADFYGVGLVDLVPERTAGEGATEPRFVVVVLSGEVEVAAADEDPVVLAEGDSACFEGGRPRFRNV
jgi:transcriptional regulator with XRE-family HTH domain